MFHTKWIFQTKIFHGYISAPFWNFVPNSPFFRASFWRQVSSCDATMSTNRRAEEDRSAGKQQGGRCSSLVQMQTLFSRSSTNCENPNKGKLQLFSWINLPRNAKTPTGKLQIDMFPIISDIVFHSKQPKLRKIVKKLLKWILRTLRATLKYRQFLVVQWHDHSSRKHSIWRFSPGKSPSWCQDATVCRNIHLYFQTTTHIRVLPWKSWKNEKSGNSYRNIKRDNEV